VQSEELFEPGEYIDQGRPGYFTLAAQVGGWKQKSYPVEHLATVVNGVNPFHDSYISQAIFERAGTSIVDVRDTAVLFADLDTYSSEELAGKAPEELAALLCAFCNREGIPEPSITLFSGRGLQSKWLLTSAVPRIDLHLWEQAEHALVRLLTPFAADKAVTNINRVLRLDHTVNTKSGEMARVVHVTGGIEGCPARYDFSELRLQLCGEVVAKAPREARQRTEGRILHLPTGLTTQRLNWTRMEDIRTLWRLRGGVPEGFRELTLFWELNFLLLAQPGRPVDIWNAAERLASEISAETFYTQGKHGTLGTLYRRAQAELPDFYTPNNQTLLDVFRIKPEEERELRTIISKAEKYRRLVAKRRAGGMLPRVSRADRPWEAEGISRSLWYERHPSAPPRGLSVSYLIPGAEGEGKPAHGGGGHTENRGETGGLLGETVRGPVGMALEGKGKKKERGAELGERFGAKCKYCGKAIEFLRVPKGWVAVGVGSNQRHWCGKMRRRP